MVISPPVITVDGPSGAGKSTLCKALNKYLRWYILDSGTIYRVFALYILQNNVCIMSENHLITLALNLDVYFFTYNNEIHVLLEGKDVSTIIRTEILGRIASQIAVFPGVREILLRYQRTMRKFPGLIANGRDMGTIVFPDALIKIFLYASFEERVRRRLFQLQQNGFNVDFQQILTTMKERDYRDYYRNISPLIPAHDAFILNSTNISSKQIINKVFTYVDKILLLS
ncbi:Cytidylate kinase [Candidatus Profftia lariciata]|uniref:(d)CMP kinase n=1 Tax=Candidatus Profftia lariciata TaxID=1987921 RepID=UPI001D01BBB9|nr:(d)CMP kinase [Candidatus Profftia lariciata]UDG81461.1 Cytidylate kinase [Candidatus Profftia lariciata]